MTRAGKVPGRPGCQRYTSDCRDRLCKKIADLRRHRMQWFVINRLHGRNRIDRADLDPAVDAGGARLDESSAACHVAVCAAVC